MNHERLITLAEAARRFPGHRGGDHVHPATLTRWILRGAVSVTGRRVRLEAVRCGSRWLTSAEAVARFMAALTDNVAPASETSTRTPVARHRAAEAAIRELERLGA